MNEIPRRRALYRYAVDTFVELLKQVQYRVREYRCNDADVRSWNKFVEYYKDMNIGEDFVRKFAEFGIQSCFDRNASDTARHRCRFSWVFGDAAIKRWNVYGMEANVRMTRAYLKTDYEIKPTARVKSVLGEVYTQVRPSEEHIKQRYYNGKRGLDWCVANTSLFFHKSTLCAACVYKAQCKEMLRVNYSKIYKLRGYDNG